MNRKMMIRLLTIVLLLIVGAGGYAAVDRVMHGFEPQLSGSAVVMQPTQRLNIHEFAGAQVVPTPQPTVPGIAIPGWTGIRIEAGRQEVSVPFYNPEDNEGWYFLTFQARLKEIDEVLFQTGLIPPGQYCNQVSLERVLPAGTHEAILFIQPYRMNSELTLTNNLEMPLVITVY